MRHFSHRWVDASIILHEKSRKRDTIKVMISAHESVECRVLKITSRAFGFFFELQDINTLAPLSVRTTHYSDVVDITLFERR